MTRDSCLEVQVRDLLRQYSDRVSEEAGDDHCSQLANVVVTFVGCDSPTHLAIKKMELRKRFAERNKISNGIKSRLLVLQLLSTYVISRFQNDYIETEKCKLLRRCDACYASTDDDNSLLIWRAWDLRKITEFWNDPPSSIPVM